MYEHFEEWYKTMYEHFERMAKKQCMNIFEEWYKTT